MKRKSRKEIEFINFKQTVAGVLKLFPEVEWDRWGGMLSLKDNFDSGFFGWIARRDGKRDFIFLRIEKHGAYMMLTSSAKYSLEFAVRLKLTHNTCQKISDTFTTVKTVH